MIENLKIFIGSRSDVSNWHDKELTHHISIRDSDVRRPYTDHFARKPNTLELIFEDLIDDPPHYANLADWSGPEEKHIVSIIRLALEILTRLNEGKKIVLGINCFAGVSRSTATAYIILCVLVGMGKEKTCFEEVLRIRNCAIPNPVMAKLADKLLDRKGELAKYAVEYRKMIEDSFKAKDE